MVMSTNPDRYFLSVRTRWRFPHHLQPSPHPLTLRHDAYSLRLFVLFDALKVLVHESAALSFEIRDRAQSSLYTIPSPPIYQISFVWSIWTYFTNFTFCRVLRHCISIIISPNGLGARIMVAIYGEIIHLVHWTDSIGSDLEN